MCDEATGHVQNRGTRQLHASQARQSALSRWRIRE